MGGMQNAVVITMSQEDAEMAKEMLTSNQRRMRNHYNKTEIMECWECYHITAALIKALGRATAIGICPSCSTQGELDAGCPSCPGFWYE